MDKSEATNYSVSESLDFLIKAAEAGDNKTWGIFHRVLVGLQLMDEDVVEVEDAYNHLSKALEEHIGNNKWKAICIKAEYNTKYNKKYGNYALSLQAFILSVAALLTSINGSNGECKLNLLISAIAIVISCFYIVFSVRQSALGRGKKRLETILDEYIEQCTCSPSCSVKLSTCSPKTAHTDCSAGNSIIVEGQGNSASINYY